MSQRKFSIITINYNNKEGLRKTIESVVGQSFRDFEYIITVSYTHLRAHET